MELELDAKVRAHPCRIYVISKKIFRYMMKSEGFHVPTTTQRQQGATFDPAVHGYHGPLSVAYPAPYAGHTAFQAYLSAALNTIPGLQRSQDVADGHPNGGSPLFFTIKPGSEGTPGGNRRSSSAVAYVYPFLGSEQKTGLTILTGHQATRIVWAEKKKNGLSVASGVKFVSTPAVNASIGEEMVVNVKREVIVASGAIGVRVRFCSIRDRCR